MAGRVRRALLSGALLSTVLPVLAVAPAAAAPTFALPFQCGQTGWLASTFAGHVPNGYAIDFNMAGDGDNGKPVLASAAGVVSHPAYSSASNPLAIDHDGGGWRSGWASLYLHMNVTVANGASVRRGDLLGYVSNVGAPGGRHLHYEQRLDGTVQPARFSHWVPDYGPAMYQGLGIAVPASDNCDAPPPPPPPRDDDGDGVADDSDVCPRVLGPANTRGCPPEDFDASSRSDFDGDGRSDVAAFYDYGGALTRGFVFSGSPAGLSNGSRFWDSGAGNFEAGRARFVAGDFNGDGRSDVAAFYDYGGALTRGFVFSGSPTGLSNGLVPFWDSGAGNFEAGRARFVAGDFNGDGRSDVAAFYDYGGALTRGFVFSGSPTGLSSGMVRFWDSGAGNFEAGRARFVAGDFDGDGRSDVAAFYDYGGALTRGFVFSGTPTGLSNGMVRFWDSGAGNFEAGRARFVAGDFNGDGRSDVAAFYDYGGALTRGFVFGGSPSGLSGGGTRFWDSGAGNFEAGRARFVAGDFNADGRSDVAAFYDYGGALTRGFVFSGTPTGLSNGMVRFWDSGAGNFEAGRSRFVGGGEIARPPAGSPPAVPPASGTPPPAPASPPAASTPDTTVISLVSSTRRSRLAKGIPLRLTGAQSRSRYAVTMRLGRRTLARFSGRATTRGVVSVKLKLSPRARARTRGRKAVEVRITYVRLDGQRRTVTRTLRLR